MESNTSPLSPDITKKAIYNTAALSIDLNGICPSIFSCSKFPESPGKIPNQTQQLSSGSLILEPESGESQGSMFNEEEAPHSQLPFQTTSHLNPHSEKVINISKCGKCNKILSKCECKLRCNDCFNLKCTCSTI